MKNIFLNSALITAIALASSSAFAGGGGCGDQCPQYKKTTVCVPIGAVQIADVSTLTDQWNIRSVSALKTSLANQPLKVDLYKTVWDTQPFDPKIFVQAWVEGLVEGESFGKGSEDLTTGALNYHGTQGTSTGWENVLVELSRPNGQIPATLQLISSATHVVLLSASLTCGPATNP